MTAMPPSLRWNTNPSGVSMELRFYALASAMVALGVYLLTLAPDLSWANAATDGGELITASFTLGISHPPGYPSYILLGKLFSLLPLGTVAFRYNLLSAVCTAAAIGLLVLAIGAFHHPRLRPQVIAAVVLLFGFSPLVWSQAVIAEVYSLNLLVLAAFLLAWIRRGSAGWSGFWLGLAITTHLTSLLFLPALIISSRHRLRVSAGIVLGLSPLLLVSWLAMGRSPVVWGQPTDPAGWWWLVSGRLYAANIHPAFDSDRFFALLRTIAIGPAALILAKQVVSQVRPADVTRTTSINSRSAPILLLGTLVLYVIFVVIYNTPDAAILLLPALMILFLLCARWLERLGTAALLLPALLVIAVYPVMDLSHEQGPRALSEELLNAAPENALLLATGDRTIFTLWYFHHVEGLRPDLTLIDANLFAFDWYRERLRALNPNISVPVGDDLLALKRDNVSNHPFCVAGLVSPPDHWAGGVQVFSRSPSHPPYLTCTEGAH